MVPLYANSEVRQNMRSRKNISPTAGAPKHSRATSIWLRVAYTFALSVLAGTLVACASGLASQGSPQIPQDRGKITGRALLIGDQAETSGYGLYSYVLFESPPTPETKPHYLAVILACLKEFPNLGGLETKYRPEMLNAMYIPLTEDIKPPSLEQSEHNRLKLQAEEILQQYNYGRAQTILNQLPKIQKNGGPYLVSSLAPVSSSGSPSVSLYQDLSAVRQVSSPDGQAKMAYEWVLDFVDRVSNPQPTAWNRDTLVKFGDEFGEARQLSFKRYNVSANPVQIVFPIGDHKADRTFFLLSWHTGVIAFRTKANFFSESFFASASKGRSLRRTMPCSLVIS